MSDQPDPRPINRRELLAGAGSGLLAVYLVGCGHSSRKARGGTAGTAPTIGGGTDSGGNAVSNVPGPPAGGGTAGGRLIAIWQAEGNSNDPAIGSRGTGWDSICNLTYAPLYTYAESYDPQPQCASDLPKVSTDGLVYTIPLRDDVVFHNGRPVVADDYLYAWDRVLDPATGSWAAGYLFGIDGAKERHEGGAKTVTGIAKVGDHTIQVKLVQPDVTFLYALTQPFMAPVPKEEVRKWGAAFQAHVVGNGPFKLTTYDPGNRVMLFDRHTAYHRPGLPYLDQVEYRWGIEADAQITQLQKGRAQVLPDGLDAADAAKMRTTPGLKRDVHEQALLAQRWVSLDQVSRPLFRDRRIRQALNWATDRDALSRVTGDTAVTFGAPFPKELPGFPRTFQPYTYDPARAKALLADARVPRPRFDLWVANDVPDELQFGRILRQQWEAIGVDARIRSDVDAAALSRLISEGRCDAWFSRYSAVYPTMIDLVSQCYETDGPSNATKYSNAQVDRLTAQARRTTDRTARDALLAQVEQIIGADAVHVFLQTSNWLMGVDLEKVHNFHYSALHGTYYDRLWLA